MGPIPLQLHFCEHCREFKIDPGSSQNRGEQERPQKNEFLFFEFLLTSMLQAAVDGCAFCDELLSDEWVHRSDIIARAPNIQDLPEELQEQLQDVFIHVPDWLPPPDANNTLRQILYRNEGQDRPLRDLVVAAKQFTNSGNTMDILDLEYFALWDLETKRVIYRSRGGFKVFTSSGMSDWCHA